MEQIGLPLPWRSSSGAADFLLSDCNREAVRHLERWTLWPVRATLLVGPPKSGRSHLAQIFAEWSGGEVLDDVGGLPDDMVFHAWNRAHDLKRPLLMVAEDGAEAWRITLPDLASRLSATPVVAIGAPDEALLAAIMAKQLMDRSMKATPALISYLLARIERSFACVAAVVDALDRRSLSSRKRVGMSLARDVLAELGFSTQ
mgnify:CR=1 FL=1